MKITEHIFETFLWNARFLVILAVISSLVGTLLLFTLATMDMFALAKHFISITLLGEVKPDDFHVEVISHIITSVDDFLLAIVMLIFALGMYELFISKIDVAEDCDHSTNILMINTLDDLKDRLTKVILMILIVTFFKNVLYVKFDDPLNILYMGAGILMVSLSVYFTHKSH
ncbi:MAG: YqhA family protein [Mariprofundaceae bacterium]|nr:YqhA family protein [Mariprofundaceae bacterium]